MEDDDDTMEQTSNFANDYNSIDQPHIRVNLLKK